MKKKNSGKKPNNILDVSERKRNSGKKTTPTLQKKPNLPWIVMGAATAAVIIITIVAVALSAYRPEPPGAVVATLNDTPIHAREARRMMSQAENNLTRDFFDMYPDEWEVDHNLPFRGGLTFGEYVREEAVKIAAVNAMIEDYARGLGIYMTDAQLQVFRSEIDDFVREAGQEELDLILQRQGYQRRSQLAASHAFETLFDDLISAVMLDPDEFARFEPYMPADDYETVLARAQEILERAHAGEDFDMLVELYGEDPGMVGNPDGYTFTSGHMVWEFENATRELEIGEISGLVRSDFGYHIIKRTEPNPDHMWEEEDDWLGAKHILIGYEERFPEDNLRDAIRAAFEAEVSNAQIEFLPALNDM